MNELENNEYVRSILNKIRQFGKSVVNNIAGSAIVENPAVMTASGWRINKSGKVVQDKQNDKEVKKLRSNLKTIGEVGVAAPTLVGDIGTITNVVKHPIKSGKSIVKSGKDLVSNISEFGKKKGFLVDNGEVDYHLQRLINGGLDKLKNQGDVTSSYFPIKVINKTDDISSTLKSRGLPEKEISDIIEYINKDRFAAGSVHNESSPIGVIIKDPEIPNKGFAISHELDHAVHTPAEPPKGFDFTGPHAHYFTKANGTEVAARGSQIKDYFEITDPYQEITPEQLQHAAKYYVQNTGIDNMMTAFFKSITDWKEAAKWISKYSSVIATPMIPITFDTPEDYYDEIKNRYKKYIKGGNIWKYGIPSDDDKYVKLRLK